MNETASTKGTLRNMMVESTEASGRFIKKYEVLCTWDKIKPFTSTGWEQPG